MEPNSNTIDKLKKTKRKYDQKTLDVSASHKEEVLRNDSAKTLLQIVRDKTGLSQKEFAKKIGIHKSTYQYMEQNQWGNLKLDKICKVARIVGMSPADLVKLIYTHANKNFVRCHVKEPFFTFSYNQAAQIGSYQIEPKKCFIGKLTLEPQHVLEKDYTPQGEIVHYDVQGGTLLVKCLWEEHVYKQGEQFNVDDYACYELYNPHQFEKTVLHFVCMPPFPPFMRHVPL